MYSNSLINHLTLLYDCFNENKTFGSIQYLFQYLHQTWTLSTYIICKLLLKKNRRCIAWQTDVAYMHTDVSYILGNQLLGDSYIGRSYGIHDRDGRAIESWSDRFRSHGRMTGRSFCESESIGSLFKICEEKKALKFGKSQLWLSVS